MICIAVLSWVIIQSTGNPLLTDIPRELPLPEGGMHTRLPTGGQSEKFQIAPRIEVTKKRGALLKSNTNTGSNARSFGTLETTKRSLTATFPEWSPLFSETSQTFRIGIRHVTQVYHSLLTIPDELLLWALCTLLQSFLVMKIIFLTEFQLNIKTTSQPSRQLQVDQSLIKVIESQKNTTKNEVNRLVCNSTKQSLIRLLNGTTKTITCTSETKVFTVKQMLLNLTGVTCDEQILCYQGKQLSDTYNLSYYQVQDFSNFEFSIRLHGGMKRKDDDQSPPNNPDQEFSPKPQRRSPRFLSEATNRSSPTRKSNKRAPTKRTLRNQEDFDDEIPDDGNDAENQFPDEDGIQREDSNVGQNEKQIEPNSRRDVEEIGEHSESQDEGTALQLELFSLQLQELKIRQMEVEVKLSAFNQKKTTRRSSNTITIEDQRILKHGNNMNSLRKEQFESSSNNPINIPKIQEHSSQEYIPKMEEKKSNPKDHKININPLTSQEKDLESWLRKFDWQAKAYQFDNSQCVYLLLKYISQDLLDYIMRSSQGNSECSYVQIKQLLRDRFKSKQRSIMEIRKELLHIHMQDNETFPEYKARFEDLCSRTEDDPNSEKCPYVMAFFEGLRPPELLQQTMNQIIQTKKWEEATFQEICKHALHQEQNISMISKIKDRAEKGKAKFQKREENKKDQSQYKPFQEGRRTNQFSIPKEDTKSQTIQKDSEKERKFRECGSCGKLHDFKECKDKYTFLQAIRGQYIVV